MSDERKLFLLGQKLYRLKAGLSADKRKEHACGTVFDEKAWDFTPRDAICQQILSEKPPLRVAMVCDAGLGKTTNTEWIHAKLAEPHGRQLPFLLNLQDPDDQDLLEKERAPGNPSEALVNRLAKLIEDQAGSEPGGFLAAIRRMQAAGRITLLIDGLDHVGDVAHTAGMIKKMLETLQWRHCPAWIAGRPTAFESAWTKVFSHSQWQFCRINELTENEIRPYMVHHAGGDWYDEFKEGKNLLAIPRLLHLICGILREAVADKDSVEAKLQAVRDLHLCTPADVYCKAFFYIGPHDDPNRQGLLAQGLQGNAEWIGLDRAKGFTPHKDNRRERVNRAAAMLGAIAFQMLDMRADRKNPKPRFDSVLLEPFKSRVADRMVAAGQGTHADFDRDFSLLKDMNIHTLDHLLFREASKERLSFHNRTTQAFFAAYWACRHARMDASANELEVTRTWVVDDLFKQNREFREFWQFAAEMHDDGLPMDLDGSVDESRWIELFTALYDGSVKDKNGPIRSTEFIYRSWPRMRGSVAGRRIIKGKYRAKSVRQELLDGFIQLVNNPSLQQDTGTFMMGESDEAHQESLTHFCIHEFCVTNLEYELFDPRRKEQGWWESDAHRAVKEAGDKSADDQCPVVMVSWYDAACYARWLGIFENKKTGRRYEITLPLEAQWEYACRAGRDTRFTFDGSRSLEVCTPAYCNYDGNYPDEGQEKGEYRKCTVPVDGQIPRAWSEAFEISAVKGRNRWGLYQMHGNVWEWCWDWYDIRASARVLRGGSWFSFGWNCRSASRIMLVPDFRDLFSGFRLAAVPCIVGAKPGRESVGDVAASVVES
jgi:formylglycine-generating enzyme required for sulfatase activity